jgi:hypothetical protein
MWEAMGRPLLPQFAKAFAGQLKAKIEECVGIAASKGAGKTRKPTWLQRIGGRLLAVWQALFGPKRDETGEERRS